MKLILYFIVKIAGLPFHQGYRFFFSLVRKNDTTKKMFKKYYLSRWQHRSTTFMFILSRFIPFYKLFIVCVFINLLYNQILLQKPPNQRHIFRVI